MMQTGFSIDEVRSQFPILNQKIADRRLVYLDNAATTQKPLSVIERLRNFYCQENSNIRRGAHTLSELASQGGGLPAAAKMPACLIPPPRIFRQRLAFCMFGLDPQRTEPTGAPSPFDKQTDRVSK